MAENGPTSSTSNPIVLRGLKLHGMLGMQACPKYRMTQQLALAMALSICPNDKPSDIVCDNP
jgi:hypothetical protein